MSTKFYQERLSVDELAVDFVDSLLAEKIFDRQKLIDKTRAYMKAFVGLKNIPNYNKKATPSQDAKRLKCIEEKQVETKFWKDIVMELDAENMQKHYHQLKARLVVMGFEKV